MSCCGNRFKIMRRSQLRLQTRWVGSSKVVLTSFDPAPVILGVRRPSELALVSLIFRRCSGSSRPPRKNANETSGTQK